MAAFRSLTVDLVACQFGSAVSIPPVQLDPLEQCNPRLIFDDDGNENDAECTEIGDGNGDSNGDVGCVTCILSRLFPPILLPVPELPPLLCGGDNKTDDPLFNVSTVT